MNRLSRMAMNVLTMGACMVVASSAFAFSIQNAYMGDNHKTVSRWPVFNLTYYCDSRAISGVSSAQSQQDMKGSFQDWQDINCSAVTFEFVGNTSNQDVLPLTGTVNGKNELVWVSGSTECKKWTFGESVLGVTVPMQDYFTGEIYESDIAFNNCDYEGKWAVNKNDLDWNEVSFKSVAIHEIGHFFGVQHSCLENSEYSSSDPATMAPYVDYYGLGDDLNADDKLAACFLYPDQTYYAGNKGLYKCSKSTDCPRIVTHDDNGNEIYDYENFTNGRLQCANGYCLGVNGSQPGTTSVGIACQNPAACMGGICTDIGDGIDRCTEECSLDRDECPTGFHCEATGGQNLCVSGNKAGAIGSACTLKADCVEGICFKALDGTRTCRKKCNNDSGCDADEYCWLNGSYGGCFPDPVVVLKGVGEYCTIGTQCETGLCVGGDDGLRCRQACETSDTCAEGYICDDASSSCLPGEEPVEPTLEVGDACFFAIDCKSGICLQGTDGKRCRAACGTGDVCADGYYCDRATASAACLPGTEPVEVLEEGEVCEANDDCRSGLCFAPTAGDTKRCRVECNLEDWYCPTAGTACVGYDTVTSGVCMPVDDRGETGDTCGAPGDCVSGICLGASGDTYCSQNCVDGWCPDGFDCKTIGSSGDFCIKAAVEPEASGGCSATGTDGRAMLPVMVIMLAAFIGLRRRACRIGR